MANYIVLTEENFEEKVLKADKPVLVDFWATWCGPCKMQAPIFEELAEEMKDVAYFGKVDVDENPGLAQAYRIMSIPMLISFKDGKPYKKTMGLSSKEELKELL